jgi:GH35 family endo-1,4-beta-xylanase
MRLPRDVSDLNERARTRLGVSSRAPASTTSTTSTTTTLKEMMTRIGPTLSVSLVALVSGLAPIACSGGVDSAPELGSSEQALSHKGPKHEADRDKPCKPHHHDRRRPCAEEPEPEPVVFTPASAAARSGRRAGVAVQAALLENDATYAQFVADYFSAVTPENEMKWGSLQPQRPNRWDFDAADAIVDFAKQHELAVKGHTLIWHNQLPPFVDASTSRHQLRHYSRQHIERTVHHFRGDLAAWDVVNEAVADDGSGLRETPFSTAFGERYIDRAFHRAHQADRDAKLYYNDYGIEGMGPKSDAVYDLMQRLLARRVPVDGVGFQGHFDARFVPSMDELVANFQRFADLGLRVNVSELDVRVARIAGSQAHRLAVQKQIYQRIAAACAQVDACEGITTWGFTDAHSWVDSTFGADDPLLFDEAYQKKPAYFGYVDGWLGVPLDDASAPNLIGNSSLEAGLEGWSSMGAAQLATDVDAAHTGLRSLRASGRAASWQGPRHDVTALVSAARSYDASLWVRLDGAASASASFTAQIACAGEDAVFQQLASGTVNDSGFTQLSGTLEVPDCDVESVAVYAEGPAAGVDLLVDDLVLREQPQANRIDNPDFESGIAGWFGWGPTVLSATSDAHGGDGAIAGTGRTASWNGVATDITADVVPTASYRASAWMKISGAASDSVVLTAAVTCAGSPSQFLRVGAATGSNEWVEVSGTFTVPNCTLQQVVLYGEGPAAGVDLLIDDVALWEVDAGLGPNAVANPDFESGINSWFGFGSVTTEASTARAHGGSRSGLVSGRTASWNGLATSLVGRLTPGASYSVSAWAQVGTGSSPVNLTFQSACDGGSESFTFVAGATANASTWTQLSGTLVAPSCNLTTANLYIEGAPAGVDIYLDDVAMRVTP